LDTAKGELKFLLMVLMSPEHDDTESFTRDTLLSPEVVDFINDPANNIILWGGNVLDSEAFQVSLEYNCTKFPFSAIICLTPKEGGTRMGIVKRLAGPMTPAAYLAAIQGTIGKYGPDLEGARVEKSARELARNLRNEQDAAYEHSLARDRERARQKRDAAAAAAAEEKRARDEAEAAQLVEEKQQQWRKWRATTIAPEPDASVKDSVRLALSMPYGAGRIVRRFDSRTTIEELYAFVECYSLIQEGPVHEQISKPDDYEHKYAFRIASFMPRETFDPADTASLGEKMGRGGVLIVEDTKGGESDSEAEA
jgi:FAS-associated factor 2